MSARRLRHRARRTSRGWRTRAPYGWIEQLLAIRQIPFPDRERDAVIASLLNTRSCRKWSWTSRCASKSGAPRRSAALRITQAQNTWGEEHLPARCCSITARGWVRGAVVRARRLAARRARVPGARSRPRKPRRMSNCDRLACVPAASALDVNPKTMPRAVRELLQRGLARGGGGQDVPPPGRRPGWTCRSGIDWFELHGEVDYGGATAKLPELLAALRRGDTMVRLGDGIVRPAAGGVAGALRAAGRAGHDAKRITCVSGRIRPGCWTRCWRRSPKSRATRSSSACASGCATFKGVARRAAARRLSSDSCATTSAKASAGWSSCASSASAAAWRTTWAWARRRRCWPLLEDAAARRARAPSLVVVPRSLVFNWKQEAARFTPQLRVLDHTGTGARRGG